MYTMSDKRKGSRVDDVDSADLNLALFISASNKNIGQPAV